MILLSWIRLAVMLEKLKTSDSDNEMIQMPILNLKGCLDGFLKGNWGFFYV